MRTNGSLAQVAPCSLHADVSATGFLCKHPRDASSGPGDPFGPGHLPPTSPRLGMGSFSCPTPSSHVCPTSRQGAFLFVGTLLTSFRQTLFTVA